MQMNYKTVTDAAALRSYLTGKSMAAFDFETAPDDKYRTEERAALDAHKSHIAGVSFSAAEGDAIYVPLTHRVGENADAVEVWAVMADFCADPGVVKIAHNLAFEAMFLYARGIVIQPPCYDTIAAAQMTLKTDTEFRSLKDSGLKKLAAEFFKAEMLSFDAVTDGRPFDELDPAADEARRYACADSDYTLRLYHLFNRWFDRWLPKHRAIVETVESPTAIYTGIMKYNGLLVNKELMVAKQIEAEVKLEEVAQKIAVFTGDVDIGANAATAAFKQFLYKDLGLPVLKTTAKYQMAADDEALVLLSEWCKKNRPELAGLFELVQEYRRWGKIKSTYIDGYLQHINIATGRIHPSLFPLGTATGRFASKNPNCQNMPRVGSDDIGVRNFIIAPPGKILLSLDLSQIELRVGAFYCRDEKMLETYRAGGDIHAQTTAVIYKIPFEEAADNGNPHYKERRTIAKNCNFGVFFGLFPKGLMRNLKLAAGLDKTLGECTEIIDNIKAGYPRLSEWQEETKRQAKCGRFSETYLGRRRYIPDITSADWGKRSYAERCALNTPIQGTAADILKLALGKIIQGLPDRPWLRPLLQIHDEVVFELPGGNVVDAVFFIKTCMENPELPGFDVPITAEAAAGPDFGNMKELDERSLSKWTNMKER